MSLNVGNDAMRDRLLDGKTVVVTGGASGIGKAIAALFWQQGANVVVADLNGRGAAAVAADLGAERALGVQADVASEASVAAMVEQAVGRFGQVDILLNCAGIPQLTTPIEYMGEAPWDRIMNINVKCVFLTTKYVVPHMKRIGGGAIVNIGSVVAVRPKPGLNAYCASKGAVIVLSESLALELAPHSIRVNVVNPGASETPMLSGFLKPGADLAQGKMAFTSFIPLRRLVQPEDVAEAALYLASPLSKIVTGTVINVDGGRAV